MTRRVALLVPDAGPLISLGRGGALDILLLLELPIYVIDQVRYEVTRDSRFPDAAAVGRFIRSHPDRVHDFQTAVGQMAADARKTGELKRQPGLGEAAIAEFLARLDEIIDVDTDSALLLFEDSDVMHRHFSLPNSVHLLSTRGLLLGMEERGLIRSADEVWQCIQSGGRSPSDNAVDRAGVVSGKPTRW